MAVQDGDSKVLSIVGGTESHVRHVASFFPTKKKRQNAHDTDSAPNIGFGKDGVGKSHATLFTPKSISTAIRVRQVSRTRKLRELI